MYNLVVTPIDGKPYSYRWDGRVLKFSTYTEALEEANKLRDSTYVAAVDIEYRAEKNDPRIKDKKYA